jgi:hypothetical protein
VIAVGALSAPDVLHNDVEGDNGVFGRGAVPKEHEPGGHASDILVLLLGVFLEKQRHVVAEGAFGVDGVIGIRERVKIVDLWRRPQRWRLCPPQPPRRHQPGRLRRPQHGRWRRPQLPLLVGLKNRHFSIVFFLERSKNKEINKLAHSLAKTKFQHTHR